MVPPGRERRAVLSVYPNQVRGLSRGLQPQGGERPRRPMIPQHHARGHNTYTVSTFPLLLDLALRAVAILPLKIS